MNATRTFPHRPESITRARRFVNDALEDVPPKLRDIVVLMVSELATNCIRHTKSGFELTLRQTGEEIFVEAVDRGDGHPTMRTPAPTDPSGRGLQIIDIFSTTWGHENRPEGKAVWFSLSLETATAA
ncbi:MAG TPA: ATP-binding protein [Solirubrobacteraceae bacterium]|nr:ATP-binding protein [Solirubrobacteraceae bacterium]